LELRIIFIRDGIRTLRRMLGVPNVDIENCRRMTRERVARWRAKRKALRATTALR